MKLSDKLRKQREIKKFSQEYISKQTKIPQTTISDFENGKYEPRASDLIKLAQVLEISITELIDNKPA